MTGAPTTLDHGGDIRAIVQKAPEVDGTEDMEQLISDAGVEVMVVDWVFQKIAGHSLIDVVIKPITGDFTKMAANAEAWRTVAEAMKQFSTTMVNNANVVGQSWKGTAAIAHEAYVDVGWRAGLMVEAGIANAIAKGFDAVADGSKKLCAKALELLKKLVDKLIEIAAKACVPVVGWAAEATTILDALQIFNMILGIIETIKDIVSKVGEMWNSLKDIGSQLAKIKDIKNLGDVKDIATGIGGDVKDIKENAAGIAGDVKDQAKDINKGAKEMNKRHEKADSSSSGDDDSDSDTGGSTTPSSASTSAPETPRGGEPSSSAQPSTSQPSTTQPSATPPPVQTPAAQRTPADNTPPHHTQPQRPRSGRISGHIH